MVKLLILHVFLCFLFEVINPMGTEMIATDCTTRCNFNYHM